MSDIINKRLLAESLVEAGVVGSVRQGERTIESLVHSIVELTHAGKTVRIQQFGTFKSIERAARMARNPATGAEIEVPARRVLKFKPSSKLD